MSRYSIERAGAADLPDTKLARHTPRDLEVFRSREQKSDIPFGAEVDGGAEADARNQSRHY
jgi:hypothetical protein